MQTLVVLCALVAASLGQVVYYTSPHSVYSPYSPISHLTQYSYAHSPAPVTYVKAPVPLVTSISSQYRAQDELGQFTFSTNGDNQARVETGLLDGSVRGAYGYVDPNGKLINVHYLADHNGFRVLGANNLPVAPDAVAAPKLLAPEPVKDTPEVEAARALFQKKFAEVEAAAKAAPEEHAARSKREAVLLPAVEAPLAYKLQLPSHASIAYTAAPHVVSPYQSLFAAPQFVAPTLARTTVKVHEIEPVEGVKVPASTKKIELKEKEKEIITPISVPFYNPYASVFA